MVKYWTVFSYDQKKGKDICSHHYFNIALGNLVSVIKQEKETKLHKLEKKKIKLFLFADDLIVCIENHRITKQTNE